MGNVEHSGVKGMKWGVHKSGGASKAKGPSFKETVAAQRKVDVANRNKRIAAGKSTLIDRVAANNSRTPSKVTANTKTSIGGKAKIKTIGGSGQKAHPDAITAKTIKQKLGKSGVHALSNHELQVLAQRAELERRVKQHSKNDPGAKGKDFAKRFIKVNGKKAVKAAAVAAA